MLLKLGYYVSKQNENYCFHFTSIWIKSKNSAIKTFCDKDSAIKTSEFRCCSLFDQLTNLSKNLKICNWVWVW